MTVKIPENFENKPWCLYFSKALFEGQIFGGAYIRRGLYTEENLRFKIGQAYTGREIYVSKSIGLAYGWKQTLSVICRKFLLKLVLRT